MIKEKVEKMKSKEEIQEYLRMRQKRMIPGMVIAFLLCYLLLTEIYGKTGLDAAIKSIVYTSGVLIGYYLIIVKPSKLQRIGFKVVVIGGTASWFSIAAMGGFIELGVIPKGSRMLGLGLFLTCFVIGAYIGTLLLKHTRLRWFV